MRRSPNTLFVFALIVPISLASAAQGQEDFTPVIIPKVSHEDGLTLGKGVSLATISPAYPSPFKDVKAHREANPNPAAMARMKSSA